MEPVLSNGRATRPGPFRRAAVGSRPDGRVGWTGSPRRRRLDGAGAAGIWGRDSVEGARMDPVEICRRMGEAKTKAIFLELTTEGMKKILREAKLPTTRMPSHTTTRKRNDDWAARTWRVVS